MSILIEITQRIIEDILIEIIAINKTGRVRRDPTRKSRVIVAFSEVIEGKGTLVAFRGIEPGILPWKGC